MGHRRSQRRGQGGRVSRNRNETNDKNVAKKPIVSSVSVSFSIFRVQQYTRTTIINNNIDYKGAQAPSTQLSFANQLKCTV